MNPRVWPEPSKTVPTNLEEVDLEDNVEILNRLEKEPSSGSVVVSDPPRAVEFLKNPRAEGKREIKINSKFREFSNLAMMLTQAGRPKREKNPIGVTDRAAYYGVYDTTLAVVSGINCTCLLHPRTGTLYWFDEGRNWFINRANTEYAGFAGREEGESAEDAGRRFRLRFAVPIPPDSVFITDQMLTQGFFQGLIDLPEDSKQQAIDNGWVLLPDGNWLRPEEPSEEFTSEGISSERGMQIQSALPTQFVFPTTQVTMVHSRPITTVTGLSSAIAASQVAPNGSSKYKFQVIRLT